MEDNKEIKIKLWEKSIDVQQHFNEIELKIRQLTLTVFTFIITAIGFLIKNNNISNISNISVSNLLIPIEAVISIIGAFIIFAFFLMDKYWYHRLLKGAVKFSLLIERENPNIFHTKELNEGHEKNSDGLTHEIGKSSQIRFTEYITIHSDQKLIAFYSILIDILLIFFIFFIRKANPQTDWIQCASTFTFTFIVCTQISCILTKK